MKIVEIRQLVKKFDQTIAVDHLDLTIESGQIFGLLGPNGAGKSTAISIICGLLRPTDGTVRLFGEESNGQNTAHKARIGLVPQEIALYPDLSAYENVRFFAGLYGLRGEALEQAVQQALKFVGLEEKAKLRPKTFSGGMKRRLNIACAIAHQPSLIIMDEPTVGIDPQSRNYILASIRRLNQEGATIIYTSHYMEEVEELCDQIAIIDQGRVIAEGSKEALIGLVTDVKETIITVANAEKVDKEALLAIRGTVAVQMEENTIRLTTKAEINQLNDMLAYLLAHDIEILTVEQQNLNLETVFLNLTGRLLRD
ncbi:ABC transporter ATP-binding protein [Listeria costaricensis]|uniref:ABC transporter ATP-binding protein n=1 Tax=Listeria costaricensis TaxID=2026604 RepID=UPI000C06A9AE|nr:ABC transporter ATP-binding protein [Listeria costaricensis]